ncbi:MAG: adenylosuccinate synthetase [Flavonifractor plautii]
MKDPDFGIYPFTTSSHTLAGFGCHGRGRGSSGPLRASWPLLRPTPALWAPVPLSSELFGDEAEELSRRGGDAGEYGATTGRPRRVELV